MASAHGNGCSSLGPACIADAPNDRLAQLARLAVGGSIVCTFPLTFSGLRAQIQGFLGNAAPGRNTLTVGLLALVSALGALITDLGAVASVTGALISTSLAYILPSVMAGQHLARKLRKASASAASGGKPVSKRLRFELLLARVLTMVGVALAAIGLHAAKLR